MILEAIQDLEIDDIEKVGPQGYSAYEIARQEGYEGTIQEWLESLKGEQGPAGPSGIDGKDGKDALINGENTIEIKAGENTRIRQEDGKLFIDSEAGYDDTEIKQEINNLDIEVEGLTENINNIANDVSKLNNELIEQEESINHLADTKAEKDEIPDVSEFVKKSVNDLINYYLKSETYTKNEVNELVGAIKTISMKIVPEKPETGESNIIYLIPSTKITTENIYDEYVYINGKWEIIGSTQIDLSNYYTKDEINTLLFDYITSNDLEEILQNYALKSDIPTKTSDIENDSDFIDKKYVDDEVEKIDSRIDEIELSKFPNAIIHGTPTINQGQVSNFSRENYLSLPAIFDLHDRGFEFNFAFRTNGDITTAQNILGSRFCIALLIENSKLKLKVSQNGTSWDLVDIEGNIDIQPNTTYYVQIYFDKLTYKLRYSLDGLVYTDIGSKVASVSPHPSQIYLGVGNNFFNPFKGIINLNKCNLKVNNSIIWTGLDDAGLQTRLATDMENIDELGIQKVREIAKEISVENDMPTNENIVMWVDEDEEGQILNPDDYALKTDLPTKTSELENDNNFVSSSNISRIVVVTEYPETMEEDVLYLLEEV